MEAKAQARYVRLSPTKARRVLDLIRGRQATDAVAAYGSRVSLVLKADIRPGYTGEITGKVERLESALERGAAA